MNEYIVFETNVEGYACLTEREYTYQAAVR